MTLTITFPLTEGLKVEARDTNYGSPFSGLNGRPIRDLNSNNILCTQQLRAPRYSLEMRNRISYRLIVF